MSSNHIFKLNKEGHYKIKRRRKSRFEKVREYQEKLKHPEKLTTKQILTYKAYLRKYG